MAVERLFKNEATEEKGERARMASFIGAMAIADLVKTTLGPKGMDKILQSTGRGHSVTVTNDGATILKSLHIDNPAAKVLVDISKVQDDEVGDGTTSVVVLAGELLREAEKLVNSKIHPMTIIAGYRMAAEAARNALLEKVMDNKQDADKFKEDLLKIAMTTLSSKILSQDKEHFATLAVDAVMRLKVKLFALSYLIELERVVQRIENQNSAGEIFHSMVESALHQYGRGSADLVTELCSEGRLSHFGFYIHFSTSVPMAVERLFKNEATEEKGERARMASFIGAMAIADLVKTTLGPKGMDKILQSTGRGHSVTVTNDGATILKSLHIDNPAAKVLVDISKVQDDEVGDGTTSVVVLAGELLREAEKLVNSKIHPMTIIAGYRMAAEAARNALLEKVMDNKQDADKFKEDLLKIAMTTLSSKILSQDKEHFATLAVDAVMRLKGSTNLESIQIIKKPGGSLKDSFLDEGFILDKKIGVGQPKRIESAKILVANTAMDTDKVKIYGARVRVDSMAKVADIEGAEKEKMREKVQKIINHGINCFVNRQLIYNFPEELFADAGVLAIEHADFDGIERLALVTGGEIASTFDNPESVKLGHCRLIEEIMIGEDKLIHFSGVEMGQACTIVLRGASPHMLDEAERSLHDALCVLSQTVNDSRVLLGGGWPEMVMAKAVDELARRTPGKRSHAIEAFSRALVAIPTTIADNAGLDSAEMIAQLRAEHQREESSAGIDVISGSVGNMVELGISESFKVKQAVLLSATEAAEMILRVDEIITCAPRQREDRI
ncbi:T-complex protein 1 subunit beta [Olea europaea var. sylvestris]|uniref:T-complex protein 1 subunit beta n=1 Tax=Olea europaea var. sylvestris TaxID=158386 RepID=UPI000C1D12EA|nr:T-complex protein 1 subunit beta [Olea europaea var. sylvestris]